MQKTYQKQLFFMTNINHVHKDVHNNWVQPPICLFSWEAIFLDFFTQFGRETSFVHMDFITTFVSLKFFEILLMFRGNVYNNVHKNCVMNIRMNKMLAEVSDFRIILELMFIIQHNDSTQDILKEHFGIP